MSLVSYSMYFYSSITLIFLMNTILDGNRVPKHYHIYIENKKL